MYCSVTNQKNNETRPSGSQLRPHFVLKPNARAFRRLWTMFNDVWAALVDGPMTQLHGRATRLLNLLGPA
jgi:hypothetical protein